MSKNHSPEWPAQVSAEIDAAYRTLDYRPVVVAIIENERGETLLVQSAKKDTEWSCPQGGIDKDEDVIDALFREIKEEVNINKEQLTLQGYKGSEYLDAEASRRDKRGFTKGKLYFFFKLLYQGIGRLRLQASELAGYEWVKPDAMDAVLALTRKEKAEMTKKYIASPVLYH